MKPVVGVDAVQPLRRNIVRVVLRLRTGTWLHPRTTRTVPATTSHERLVAINASERLLEVLGHRQQWFFHWGPLSSCRNARRGLIHHVTGSERKRTVARPAACLDGQPTARRHRRIQHCGGIIDALSLVGDETEGGDHGVAGVP